MARVPLAYAAQCRTRDGPDRQDALAGLFQRNQEVKRPSEQAHIGCVVPEHVAVDGEQFAHADGLIADTLTDADEL